jgi:TIR domain/PEGA domain
MTGIKVFLSYAHVDETFQKELDQHLGALKHEGIIEIWWDRQLPPGADWNQEILQELEAADLILLLVSPAFLNSDFCYKKEMRCAVERHNAGMARVVPIFLRACHWTPAPFAKLQGLPNDMKPVASWPKGKRDAVWTEVAKGIHRAAEECIAHRMIGSLKRKADNGIHLFQIPFPRNQLFTGRQKILAVLHPLILIILIAITFVIYGLFIVTIRNDEKNVSGELQIRNDEKNVSGKLQISVNVEGAKVSLDGSPIGTSRTAPLFVENVALGEHQIFVEADGFEPQERRVYLADTKPIQVGILLRPR